MKKIILYTDGACSNNPGIGGWGAVLMYKENKKELSGHFEYTTNNRMEILAAVEGLRALKEPCEVEIYSDSALLVNSINKGWLEGWQKNKWRTSAKEDVKNQDLWKMLICELDRHKVTFIKVKGHSDNEFNNRCDELARAEIKYLAENLKLNEE
ncbi:MAG: ribonuclease HI [Bacillota bacterium]